MMLDYQLLDFGAGRKLERFGSYLLDRLAPSAQQVAFRSPELWRQADFRFVPDKNAKPSALGFRGHWETHQNRSLSTKSPEVSITWNLFHHQPEMVFRLALSPFGHIGVFPEQQENWRRIARYVSEGVRRLGREPKVLNLFAYTGGSTLAAASGGAQVVHLDAARNIVERAKENAVLSHLEESIRFIADDAVKFVRREVKRGNRYDAVILDPPTYGHGSRGEVWRLERDLPQLLSMIRDLLNPEYPMILLTGHTPKFKGGTLETLLKETFSGAIPLRYRTGPMDLKTDSGRVMNCGYWVMGTSSSH